ncbi:hypothetical protein B0G80_0412 [Paraburkholderia sp. BL6669N2]|uniref:hypothetical protein n=1 Tax=Paraburkholderia sp. BL6669N2 TaxID=1938807 RepID=UPI000E278AFB|nr:hypothetical protein [Paraburkholderia sp. BL6669N2]REG57778.1 hypothetical protein B0G80_0412 [Paraburkholderia sp. BL6669N2]
MNSNNAKFVAYAALALACALIIAVWGLFAFYGRTPVDGFISQLGGLLTIIVGAIAALGATHVATSAANRTTLVAGTLSEFVPPPAAPAPSPEPAAPVQQ